MGGLGKGGFSNNRLVLKPDVAIASEVSIPNQNSLAITDFDAKKTQHVQLFENPLPGTSPFAIPKCSASCPSSPHNEGRVGYLGSGSARHGPMLESQAAACSPSAKESVRIGGFRSRAAILVACHRHTTEVWQQHDMDAMRDGEESFASSDTSSDIPVPGLPLL